VTDHSASWYRLGVNWAVMTYCAVGVAVSGQAADLPVPCVAGSCGPLNTSNTFVSSGAATAVVNGNTMNVKQTTSSAVLNWRSFNISEDGTVNFIQPDAAATAINRIFDIDVSR
jgi:large exoprotein involved in heme utilization and adhesion